VVTIQYAAEVRNWLTPGDVRDVIRLKQEKGGPLRIKGNLTPAAQMGLLKITEEAGSVEIVTGSRLSAALESRAAQIEGQPPITVNARFVGIAMLDKRTGEALTELMGVVRG